MLTLKKSYRSTKEIMDFANGVAGVEGEEAFERHGKVPGYVITASVEEMIERLAERLGCFVSGFETTAILTRTMDEAKKLYNALKDRLPVTLLTQDSSHMAKGIVITTFYLAKGLEFDSVHVVFVQKDTYYNDYHRQILYIAATRALHELNLYGVGEKSPLVEI